MAINRKKRKISINRSKLPPVEKSAKIKPTKPTASSQRQAKNTDEKPTGFKVISGTRQKRRIVNIVSFSTIAVLVIVVLIVSVLSPTGIIEAIQNEYVAMGSGSYPVNIYSKNATSFDKNNDVMCVVNDSFFEVYNYDGMLVQAASHGMSNPKLEVSDARFLLFDRDRYTVKTYNYGNELNTTTFEQTIITASIGRDGTYAVVTNSKSFLNTVYVYNSKNELIYSWNSANYYVVDVTVSNDGDSIAVCLIGAENGAYVSKVYILDFDDASPKYSYSFNTLLTSIMQVNNNYFTVNGINSAYILEWDEFSSTEIVNSSVIRNYCHNSNGVSCFAYGRETNEQLNTICIVDKKGVIINTFTFNARINDISMNDSKIAVLSNGEVHTFNFNSESLGVYSTETNPIFVCMTNDYPVSVDSTAMNKLTNTKK